jgi:hypothetical protein
MIPLISLITIHYPFTQAPTNFLLKWSVGRPRPEEIAMLIENGIITTEADGVPTDVVSAVKAMNLERAEDFTAYQEGCPLHPSWPAMHSASSASSLWLAVVANLTPSQYGQQVLRTDYAVTRKTEELDHERLLVTVTLVLSQTVIGYLFLWRLWLGTLVVQSYGNRSLYLY